MTETVWEQIQAKSTKVNSLETLYDKTKKEFESDGIVTKKEREGLERIDNGIKVAKAKVKELEAEFLKNKKKWEDRAKDLSKVKKQYDDLADWNSEAEVLVDIDSYIVEAGEFAEAMKWLDAIEQLDYAVAYTEVPYKEFQRQLPFRDDYNRDHPKLYERSENLYEHEFYELESITHSLKRYQHSRESAEGAADALRYDDACRYLNDAKETLDDIDKDIDDLTKKKAKCTAELNGLLADASIYAKSEFDSVQKMNEAFEEARNDLQEMIDEWKFDEALANYKVARKMIDAMKAKHESEEAKGGEAEVEDADADFLKNKKKWEDRAKDLSKVKKQYDDLADWNGEAEVLVDIDSYIVEAGEFAEAMEWLNAIEQLDYAVAYTEVPYKEFQRQLPFRDDYNRDRPKLKDRSKKIREHEFYELESIKHSFAVYESQMESAEGAADALRYDDACRYLNDAKETLDDIDKDIDDLTKKQAKCTAELNSLLADASIYAKSEFDSVQKMNEAFEEARNDLQEMLDEWKFDEALANFKVARKMIDAMKAKHESEEAKGGEAEVEDATGEDTDAAVDAANEVIEGVENAVNDAIDTAEGGVQGDVGPPIQNDISGSVGRGGKNAEGDVMTVQQLLNDHGDNLEVDGQVGPKTIGAISKLQQAMLGFADGRVDPGGKTWEALTDGGAAGKDAANDVIDEAEKAANDVIDDAEKAADDVIDDAEKAADDIIDEAEKAADDIIDEAEKAADDIIDEAVGDAVEDVRE